MSTVNCCTRGSFYECAADRAAVETAKVNLTYTTINSPIDGRTGNLMVHRGNVVKANDIPLITIHPIGRKRKSPPRDQPLRIICHEGKTESMLAQLILHELDLVLTDSGVGFEIKVKAFNHLLGECGLSIFATAKLAAHYRRRFPQSLDGAPFLLPTDNTAMRRSLNQWFDNQGIRPVIVGAFEDSALPKVFRQFGKGLFAPPSVIDREVEG